MFTEPLSFSEQKQIEIANTIYANDFDRFERAFATGFLTTNAALWSLLCLEEANTDFERIEIFNSLLNNNADVTYIPEGSQSSLLGSTMLFKNAHAFTELLNEIPGKKYQNDAILKEFDRFLLQENGVLQYKIAYENLINWGKLSHTCYRQLKQNLKAIDQTELLAYLRQTTWQATLPVQQTQSLYFTSASTAETYTSSDVSYSSAEEYRYS